MPTVSPPKPALPRDPSVCLKLLTGDELLVQRSELVPAILHRNVVIFHAGCVAVLLALDIRGEAAAMPTWAMAIFFSVSQCIGIGVVLAFLLWWSARGNQATVAIRLSGPIAASALVMVGISELRVWVGDGPVLTSPLDLGLLWFLFYVIGEVEVVLLCTYFAPAILHEIRQNRIKPAQPDSGIAIGSVAIDPVTIRHIRAEGNYVDVQTDDARHYLLATFSALVARLPAGLGEQVHRSHWVAARVLDGFWRDGRDIVIRLDDGTEVRVAQSRQRDVIPWLEQNTSDLRKKRGRGPQSEP